MQPDGSLTRVPFLSAASVRHALREKLAWFLVDCLEIPNHSLSKTTVDLLFTGGAVTSTGSKTDLEMLRQVEEHLPMLTMLGFAARSDIITGTLRASDLILVCQENAWRLPTTVGANALKAAAYRSEEFGTRHDQTTSGARRLLEILDEFPTAQMIWDTQILMAGAQLYGELILTDPAGDVHATWLGAALALWAGDGIVHVGAKNAQGYGTALISGIDFRACNDSLIQVEAHLKGHKTEILELLKELEQ